MVCSGSRCAARGLVLTLCLGACSDGGPGGGTEPPPPDPTLAVSVSPASLSLVQGGTATASVAIARGGGFAGAVDLTMEGRPEGLTAGFSPASVAAGGTVSSLGLTAAPSLAPGTYTVTVRARGQGVPDATSSVSVVVEALPGIGLSVAQSSLSVVQGGEATTSLAITRTNYTGAVGLSVSGAPAGITASVTPPSTTGTAATLTVVASGGAAIGSHLLTVRATGSGVAEQTVAVTLTVTAAPSLTLALSASALTVQQGASGSAAVLLTRTSFSGAVALAVSGVPAGVSATVSPASVTGTSATLTVDVEQGAATGTHTLTVTATGEGVPERSATLQLTIAPSASVTLSVTPEGMTIPQAQTGSATVTVSSSISFIRLGLWVSAPTAGIWASIAPDSIDGRRPGASTLNVFVDQSTVPGVHAIVVHGETDAASGAACDSVTLMVTVQERPMGIRWTHIETGTQHTCALDDGGVAYCWGYNGSGAVGDGTNTGRTRAVAVASPHRFTQLSAYDHTCGITTAGVAYCWGHGFQGQLGFGLLGNRNTPQLVTGGHVWRMVSAGSQHSCGITTAGEGYCWGANHSGQLGSGGPAASTLGPVAVLGSRQWETLTTGHHFTCGITTGARELYCWGTNAYGQLGVGTTTAQPLPTLVQGGRQWSRVSAGTDHVCALTTAGEAYCWGRNASGQLGDGSLTNRSVPTPVAGGRTWSAIDAGIQNTCALEADGSGWCWGNPVGSENANSVQRREPVRVDGGFTWTWIAANGTTCGTTASFTAYCWGAGSSGQLGRGTLLPSNLPTLVWDP
jgi:alpha-tubulin suppressor-like RCC1 family protein/uncharacterized membrane protein